MNCKWLRIDDPSGLRTYHCGRPTCKLHKKRIRIPATSSRLEPHRCRGLPLWHELGSWLALFLGIFWITPENVGFVMWLLGFKKKREPCRRCGQREEAINTRGEWFASWLFRMLRLPKP